MIRRIPLPPGDVAGTNAKTSHGQARQDPARADHYARQGMDRQQAVERVVSSESPESYFRVLERVQARG